MAHGFIDLDVDKAVVQDQFDWIEESRKTRIIQVWLNQIPEYTKRMTMDRDRVLEETYERFTL